MELKEIQELLKLVNRISVSEVEIEKEGFRILIRKEEPETNVIYTSPQNQAVPMPQMAVPPLQGMPETQADVAQSSKEPEQKGDKAGIDDHNLYSFTSPMIGTFYRAPTPEDPVFVHVGDQVQKGQVLCIIEAMKLFNEIESEIEGKVVKILVENAQPVEYGQPLFLIEPAN